MNISPTTLPDDRETMQASSGTLLSTLNTILAYVGIFVILLPLFLVVTARRLDVLVPVRWSPAPGWTGLGIGLMLAGSGVMGWAMVQLWREGRGLPISHLPPQRFVAKGLYALVRHPIYLGATAACAGLALAQQSFWMFSFCVPLLTVGWMCYVRVYEEPALLRRFGDSYRSYRQEVGLFAPKPGLNEAVFGRAAARASRWLTAVANRAVLFRRGRFILVTYGALIAFGSVVMMQHLATLLLAQGVGLEGAAVYLGAGVLASIFFARLFWWLGGWRTHVRAPLLGLRRVGFVSWGGLFGLLLVSAWHAWAYEVSLLVITDVLSASMFIGYAFGRVGCLTYGCCYGRPVRRYGVVYKTPQAKVVRECGWDHPRRHPTQVYSAAHGLALVFVLNVLVATGPPLGVTTALAFMLYATFRAVIEWYRDRRRYVRGLFTSGHAGCLVLFFVGWGLLFVVDPSVRLVPWTRAALVDSLRLWPLVLGLGGVVLLVMGTHWKRIGQW